jgi:hypothetical protein
MISLKDENQVFFNLPFFDEFLAHFPNMLLSSTS